VEDKTQQQLSATRQHEELPAPGVPNDHANGWQRMDAMRQDPVAALVRTRTMTHAGRDHVIS
jgi:hypothetical protein